MSGTKEFLNFLSSTEKKTSLRILGKFLRLKIISYAESFIILSAKTYTTWARLNIHNIKTGFMIYRMKLKLVLWKSHFGGEFELKRRFFEKWEHMEARRDFIGRRRSVMFTRRSSSERDLEVSQRKWRKKVKNGLMIYWIFVEFWVESLRNVWIFSVQAAGKVTRI